MGLWRNWQRRLGIARRRMAAVRAGQRRYEQRQRAREQRALPAWNAGYRAGWEQGRGSG